MTGYGVLRRWKKYKEPINRIRIFPLLFVCANNVEEKKLLWFRVKGKNYYTHARFFLVVSCLNQKHWSINKIIIIIILKPSMLVLMVSKRPKCLLLLLFLSVSNEILLSALRCRRLRERPTLEADLTSVTTRFDCFRISSDDRSRHQLMTLYSTIAVNRTTKH